MRLIRHRSCCWCRFQVRPSGPTVDRVAPLPTQRADAYLFQGHFMFTYLGMYLGSSAPRFLHVHIFGIMFIVFIFGSDHLELAVQPKFSAVTPPAYG